MARYNMSLCSRYTVSSSQPSAAEDPAPLVSELLFSDPRIQAKPGACAAVLDENPQDPSFLAYTRQNLDGSEGLHQDHPLNVRGAGDVVAACNGCCTASSHMQAPLTVLSVGLKWQASMVCADGCEQGYVDTQHRR